jgi:hypothetical protein
MHDTTSSENMRDRRQHPAGSRCPSCQEFVEERWATVTDGTTTYVCWAGHRWTDRRRGPSAAT